MTQLLNEQGRTFFQEGSKYFMLFLKYYSKENAYCGGPNTPLEVTTHRNFPWWSFSLTS